MTRKQMMTAQVALLGLFAQTNARIKDSGLWDDNDWYDSANKIGVRDGVPYSNDDAVARRIGAPLATEGAVEDYMDFENVQRVAAILPESKYDEVFPMRNDLYEYQGFLRAIAKFPKFCGESNLGADYDASYNKDLDKTCKRELAFLFAHFGQETGYHDPYNAIPEWKQALWHITEWNCTLPQTGRGTAACDYKASSGWAAEEYPPQADVQYYGRGPFQLSWNYNYGAFSEVLVESSYNSRMYLLENPDLVHTDAFTVFTSALWFYMTPQSPKPSIHDVATGYYVPTQNDLDVGMVAGFGVTTNIINGGQECGGGYENTKSQSRITYYQAFLDYFSLPAEQESTMTCGGQPSAFPNGGYGDALAYFDEDWSGDEKCRIVKWQTPYSIYTMDDYKRCICDLHGNGEADCAQADDGDSNNNDDNNNDGDNNNNDDDQNNNDDDQNNNDDDQNNNDDDQNNNDDQNGNDDPVDGGSDPTTEFQQIWANPHYDTDTKSRTMFQVDRSLDFIEEKLTTIHAIFLAKGLISA